MRLKLLAPIFKREIKRTSIFFLLEASLLALDMGVDRLYTEIFLPWSDLVCPLPTQVLYSSLQVLPPRWGGDAPGVDLMGSQTDVHFLTIKILLASAVTWGAMRVTFQNASWANTARGNIHFLAFHDLEYIPEHNKTGMNIKPICSFQVSPHQYKQ